MLLLTGAVALLGIAHADTGAGASAVPAAAAEVGYNTLTFGPGVALGKSWFPWEFYASGAQPAGFASQNADGTLALSGKQNNNYGAALNTAKRIAGGNGWSGSAFGGGAYFEAVLSFTGQTIYSYPNGGPAFWLKDIEQFSQGPYPVNWPGGSTAAWNPGTTYSAGQQVSYNGQLWQSLTNGNVNHAPPNPWPGANAYWTGYNDFIEIDVMEYDSANEKYPYTYQVNFANWHGIPTTGSGPSEQWAEAVPGSIGSIAVPSGTDFSKPHRYGFLWVPATGSGQTTRTPGYAKAYFDGVQVAKTAYWNYHDPHDTAGYPKPPPILGDSCLSAMDWRHLVPILGTDPQHPMTVQSVSVWQASAANNIEK